MGYRGEFEMTYQLPLLLVPPGYITPEEALRRRQITKEQYERIIHGGLTKKEHDRMIAKAEETNREFRRRMSEVR